MSETPKTTPTPEIVMSSDRYAGDDVHSVSCLIKFGPIYRAVMMQHLGECGPDILEGRDELARLIVRSVNARQKMLDALKAESSMQSRDVNPFGHRCQWCGNCCDRVRQMRLDAIKAAESEDGLG